MSSDLYRIDDPDLRLMAGIIVDHEPSHQPIQGRVSCTCREWHGSELEHPVHVARVLQAHGVGARTQGTPNTGGA